MTNSRKVFFISDGTGITAEALGHSLLSQFDSVEFDQERLPFVDTEEKARAGVQRIAAAYRQHGQRPIVIATFARTNIAEIIKSAPCLLLDFFEAFIAPLEGELGVRSTHTIGRSHGVTRNPQDYIRRIDAVNYALAHDDGVSEQGLDEADVILVGVSRSGKTPTSLYLALQFGLKAANYPLIPEDFERNQLPRGLQLYRTKLFGLTIAAERLAQIRSERRPGSRYAALENCQWELQAARELMQREAVPMLDSTAKSVEEIAAALLQSLASSRPT